MIAVTWWIDDRGTTEVAGGQAVSDGGQAVSDTDGDGDIDSDDTTTTTTTEPPYEGWSDPSKAGQP